MQTHGLLKNIKLWAVDGKLFPPRKKRRKNNGVLDGVYGKGDEAEKWKASPQLRT